MQKRCYKCKKRKPFSKFSKNKRAKDGLQPQCKDCDRAYRQTHKVERAKCNKKYQQTCRIKISEQQKGYYQINKTKINKRHEKYRQVFENYLRFRFYSIQNRCNSPKCKDYDRYGAKGVKCLFKNAAEFIDCVMNVLKVNTYKKIKDKQIHRINNDGYYEKNNIEFLTPAQHAAKHKAMRKDKP